MPMRTTRKVTARSPEPVTFAGDVAPIIFDACAPCHRPGGPAPFSLLAYSEVKRRATQIAAVTERRFMPPWKAEPEPGGFIGQRRLTNSEIQVIRRWVDAGAPEGERKTLPLPPQGNAGWQLGRPDLIVTLAEPYVLRAEGTDVFRIFAIHLPVATRQYVRGLEFQPGNPRVVHHANIRIDRTPASRQLDAADPAPGYDGLMPRSAVYPDGHFLGWTPGQVAPLVASDLAWPLDPGADLVVQLHMQPSGGAEKVQPSIGLFFGREPPTRAPAILRLGSQGIDIPAGERSYVVEDSFVLPVDVDLHAIQPHAHYRARTIRGFATVPDATNRSLIRINDWDFRWQHVYRYERPLALPRGTTLSMRYLYDNSADNPRNPQLPPVRVLWGQRSFDEMGDLWFQMVARDERDRLTLNRLTQRKMVAEDVIGYKTMLRAAPNDPELHDDVAMLYLELGQPHDAARHFSAAAALKSDSSAAHFNLGTALALAGRLDEAVRAYQQALSLNPNYAKAHNNLASALVSQGKPNRAVYHFREAVRLDPQNADALKNLAWRLATASDGTGADAKEAVRLAERAVEITSRRDAHALDALAAAYAATGRFDRAVEVAEEALKLAPPDLLASAIRERQARYRQGRLYRER